MSKTITFYDKDTGEIIQTASVPPNDANVIGYYLAKFGENVDYIDGDFSSMGYTVDVITKKAAKRAERVKKPSNKIDETYVGKRSREYPGVQEQLDAIWNGGQEMEDMRATIEAVKTKYPKP